MIVRVIILLLISAAPLAAQWSDAGLPRAGELRVGLATDVTESDRRFSDGRIEPSSDVFVVNVDSVLRPSLQTLDMRLAALFDSLGRPAPEPSSVGVVRYDVLIERTRIPLRVTAGITDWLSVSGTVPLVQGKSFVGLVFDSASAAAGPGSTAFAGNSTSFFEGLGQGIEDLDGIVSADTLPPDRQEEAQELLARARALEGGLMGLVGLEYLPTDSGPAGREIHETYDEVMAGFADLDLLLPELVLAQPPERAELAGLTSGPEYGIDELLSRDTGYRLGDVEVGIDVQPLNTFPTDTSANGLAIRARLGAAWRFATGDPPAANRLTDPGTGDGQSDLELRSALDVALGDRVWVSAAALYTIQREGEVRRLITDPERPLQRGAFVAPVRWDPGDELTLVVVPRFNLTRYVTLGGMYHYRERGRDRVLSADENPSAPFSPGALEQGTGYSIQSIGLVMRLSSAGWTAAGRPSIPLEVELRYRRTVAADRGLAPHQNVWQVHARWYHDALRW